MSDQASQGDFFDRARAVAAAGMLAAATACIVGSLLEWISIVRLPDVLPESEARRAHALTGIETGDGWWVVFLATIAANAALLLWVRRRSMWGWIGFLCSVVIGSIAISAYRGISEPGSGLLQQLDVVGELDHGLGLLLVLAGALLGVIFSLVGVAASPAARRSFTESSSG